MTKGKSIRQKHGAKPQRRGVGQKHTPQTAEVMTEAVLAASHLSVRQLITTSPAPRGTHEQYGRVCSNCGNFVSSAHQQERSSVVSVGLPAVKHSCQRSTGSCGLAGQTGACPGLQAQQGPTQELLLPSALHIQ